MIDNSIEKKSRFLIIEDVEDDALLLAEHIHDHGMKIHWYRVDTRQALQQAMTESWDFVFSDYNLPGFSGLDALDIVRKHDKDVPFVFISGTLGEENAVEAMKHGAQDFLAKDKLARVMTIIKRELNEVKQRRNQRETSELINQLSMVIQQASDSIFITDKKGRIEYANPSFRKLTGYSLDEVKGMTPSFLKSGYHGKDYYQRLWRTISKGETFKSTTVNKHKNGNLFYEEKTITPFINSSGEITHYVSTARDITARIEAERGKNQLATIMEASPDLVAILKPDGKMRYLNGSGCRLLGISSNRDIEGRSIDELFSHDLTHHVFSDILPAIQKGGSWYGETTLTTHNGKIPVSMVAVAHYDDHNDIDYFSIIARDISQQKEYESELQHQATHDKLTGLPNRFYLIDRIETSLRHAKRNSNNIAVMFLDMNDFKRVNDNLGHAAGDQLLQEASKRLRACLRPNDIVARHGGDEFAIMINDLEQEDSILAIIRKLHYEFERPIKLGSNEIYLSFSTGIAMYPHDGKHVDELLQHADTAMYRAKQSGSSQYCFYSPDMNEHGHEALALEADLRNALSNMEFELHYQPQVNVQKGTFSGVEALIRWQHSTRGLVSPIEFIPVLENSNQIIQVGEWILHEASEMYQRWGEEGITDRRISINVSPAQFRDKDLIDKVKYVIRDKKLPHGALELEITENIVMQDPMGAADIIAELHCMGVRTAIDDFGTGYSSLAYLKRFPVNVLKIDRSFINDLVYNKQDAAIVETCILMARKLGIEIVAEGVETFEQLDFLCRHGCDVVQGYYFSRPLPEAELMKLVSHTWHVIDTPEQKQRHQKAS